MRNPVRLRIALLMAGVGVATLLAVVSPAAAENRFVVYIPEIGNGVPVKPPVLPVPPAPPVPPVTPVPPSDGTRVVGSGNVVTQPRDAKNFSSVELRGVGAIRLTQGDAEAVSVETDDNIQQYIQVAVIDGVLVVTNTPNVSFNATRLTVNVTAKTLTALTLSGTGRIDATGLIGPALDVRLTGTGSIRTAGTATSQSVLFAGTGSYQGCALQTATTTLDHRGVGSVSVAASDRLTIDLSGTGLIQYFGNPVIEQTITGLGRVRPGFMCPSA